jgi:hypothetical protein
MSETLPDRCQKCGENPVSHSATVPSQLGPLKVYLCAKCWDEWCMKHNFEELRDPPHLRDSES